MALAFFLSMPNRASWNGRWSGEDKVYAIIIKTPRAKKTQAHHKTVLDGGPYWHNFGDGWSARIDVRMVDAVEASKIRRKSKGFCGYDWMVKNIMFYGDTTVQATKAIG